jgi:hypothetical protein
MSCETSCKSWNYSSCILWNAPKIENEYFEVCVGDSLSKTIKAMVDFMTENISQSEVYISSTDECTGYLSDKIDSESLDIDIVTGVTGCEKLMIEIPDPEWTDFTFASTYSNQGTEDARASVNTSGRVELRGKITGTNVPANSLITTLDAEFRPADTRTLNVVVNNSGNYYSGIILIASTGTMNLFTNTSGWTGTTGIISITSNFYYID